MVGVPAASQEDYGVCKYCIMLTTQAMGLYTTAARLQPVACRAPCDS